MTYGSVCSGIEAATAAWYPLGWTPAWFAETDRFCNALLRHHYPSVKSYGDFTQIGPDAGPVDLLVGGTPCQAFSVAGRRAGLDDERGNLTLEFIRLAGCLRPRWLVWENVPGVLSLDGGRTFGTILGRLAELGYGFAYRVLDAQYFGVPQRRRRVFLVGYFGDWRPAAAVLFERHCLSGNPPPRREAGKDAAGCLSGGAGERGWSSDTDRMTFVPDTAGTLKSNSGGGGFGSDPSETFVPELSYALNAHPSRRYDAQANETFIAHSLRAEGFDASEDGTGRGTPLVPVHLTENLRGELTLSDTAGSLTHGGEKPGQGYPCVVVPILEANARTGKSTTDPRAGMGVGDPGDPMFTLQSGKQHAVAFSCKDHGADAGEVAPTLRAMPHDGSHANGGGQVAVAFTERGRDQGRTFEYQEDIAYCLTNPGSGGRTHSRQLVTPQMAVRRLTPRECERLQGFPDDYTLTPYRGKAAADGNRYKALGNSMAVPVMRWLGERIEHVDAIAKDAK